MRAAKSDRNTNYSQFNKNSKGVVELPMKIFIIAIVLAITVPLVLYGLAKYTEDHLENVLINQIGHIENTAVLVFSQGENASMVIDIELPDNTQWVHIGNSLSLDPNSNILNPLSSLIEYKLDGKAPQTKSINTGVGMVPMCNEEKNDFVVLSKGPVSLALTKLFDPEIGTYYIQIIPRETL